MVAFCNLAHGRWFVKLRSIALLYVAVEQLKEHQNTALLFALYNWRSISEHHGSTNRGIKTNNGMQNFAIFSESNFSSS
jgi:hypothetical protein